MPAATPEYVPGACNIAGREVTSRKVLGWLGLAATVGLGAFLFVTKAPTPWRLILALPATLSALGFLQSSRRFCVGYGFLGVSHVGPDASPTEAVVASEARRADRRTALGIAGLSALIGTVIATAASFLPA